MRIVYRHAGMGKAVIIPGMPFSFFLSFFAGFRCMEMFLVPEMFGASRTKVRGCGSGECWLVTQLVGCSGTLTLPCTSVGKHSGGHVLRVTTNDE